MGGGAQLLVSAEKMFCPTSCAQLCLGHLPIREGKNEGAASGAAVVSQHIG